MPRRCEKGAERITGDDDNVLGFLSARTLQKCNHAFTPDVDFDDIHANTVTGCIDGRSRTKWIVDENLGRLIGIIEVSKSGLGTADEKFPHTSQWDKPQTLIKNTDGIMTKRH
jgi:hypothetical protein